MMQYKKGLIVKCNCKKYSKYSNYLILGDVDEKDQYIQCVEINEECNKIVSEVLTLNKNEIIPTTKYIHESLCNLFISRMHEQEETLKGLGYTKKLKTDF